MILAIDCGSTNLKAALYDSALRRIALHSVPLVYGRRDAVYVEFDAEVLWETFQRLIRELLQQAGCRFSDIRHMALGSQAQSFCLLDSRDRPLLPFVSWMDVRAAGEAKGLAQAFGADFHRHCSFPAPSPALENAKLAWVRTHMPEVWARARRLVSVPGFFTLRLAGLNLMDTNLAAMNGLYSLAGQGWWSGMLDYCGVPGEWLPELAPAGRAWSGVAALSGLPPASCEFVLAGNDHTAGAMGNGCRPGEIIVTFGTALVAYRRAGLTAGPFNPGGVWGPYPLGGFYELASSSYGCNALDWAREILLPGRSAAEFDALAALAKPGCGGVRFFPERVRTEFAWEGQGTPADKARAVLEGILATLRDLLGTAMRSLPAPQVCALGGGSKSPAWMQMAADALGCPVRIGQGDSLLGAAALAAGSASELESKAGESYFPAVPELSGRIEPA